MSTRKNIKKVKSIWRGYNLSIVLACLFIATWAAQFLVQIQKVKNGASDLGKAFTWDDFWPEFLTSTLENWQS